MGKYYYGAKGELRLSFELRPIPDAPSAQAEIVDALDHDDRLYFMLANCVQRAVRTIPGWSDIAVTISRPRLE